jgi:ribosome maturation factor RimP
VAFTAAFFALDNDQSRLDQQRLDQPRLTGLQAKIAAIVVPSLSSMGYELVRVAVVGRDRPTVQIMADRADGRQIKVEDCEMISRALGAVLDVEDPLSGAWSLEVSSAGIDRPLTRVKDWNRFAGHLARAEVASPIAGQKRFSGIVLGADQDHARLCLDNGTEVALPLADLRRARLVLTDDLIAATARMYRAHENDAIPPGRETSAERGPEPDLH